MNNSSKGEKMSVSSLKLVSDNTPKCQYCGATLKTRVFEIPGMLRPIDVLEYPCQCLDKEDVRKRQKMTMEAKQRRFDKLFSGSMMPKRFKDKTFYNSDSNKDPENFKKAMHYAKCFNPESGKGIKFNGDIGRGKTHYMACISNYLMEHGYSVYFTTYYELSERYFKDSDIMKEVLRADFVVIDEFGTTKITPYSNDILRRVTDALYKENKCVGITINPDIQARLNEEEYLESTHDRILEMCPTRLEFRGKSLRGE